MSATGVVTGARRRRRGHHRDRAERRVGGFGAMHVDATPPPTSADFHINEIHYDNVGTDTGEAIEIEGPAGADITGFTRRALQRQRRRALQHADR